MNRAETMTLIIRICLGLLTVSVGILVFGPFSGAEKLVGLTDKEAHVLAFYGLTGLGLLALPRVRRWDVMLVCLTLGGVIEIVQAMIGRDAEIADMLADCFGVLFAMLPMTFQSLRRAIRGEAPSTPRRRRTDRPSKLAEPA